MLMPLWFADVEPIPGTFEQGRVFRFARGIGYYKQDIDDGFGREPPTCAAASRGSIVPAR